jgi:hypothetical protein
MRSVFTTLTKESLRSPELDPSDPSLKELSVPMYQDHQQYATTSNNYLTHAGPSGPTPSQVMSAGPSGSTSVAPLDTTTQPTQANALPLVATGDWTKDLVHLAKTAELKYDYLDFLI